MIKTKNVQRGKWRTLEYFWNTSGIAFYRSPAGAKIKVRYGVGFLGKDGQVQTLNGSDYKRLEIGAGSIVYARMQIKVEKTTNVTYDVIAGGGVLMSSPEISF